MKILLPLLLLVGLTVAGLIYMQGKSEHVSSDTDMLQLGNFAYQEKRFDDALDWYTKAALEGKAKAQFQLAQMYIQGQGTDPDDKLALRWMHAAAKQGLSRAEYAYATMLEFGRGMEAPQPEQALIWYKKAAQHGSPKAMLKLAKLLMHDERDSEHIYQALHWALQAEAIPVSQSEASKLRESITDMIHKRANNNDSRAQYEIALMYQEGKGVAQDKPQALYWLRKAANQGYTQAQYALGQILSQKPSSWEESLRWLALAAQQGHAQAGYILAALMARQPSPEHAKEAWRWLYHGMRNADAKSLYNLAVILRTGKLGLKKTEKHTLKWLTMAANQHITFAQNDAGVSYILQHENIKKSLAWLTQAANAGDMLAQFNLGLLFARGEGITPNDEKALHWWTMAEKNGSTKAPMMLGLFYHIGRGTGRSEKEAIRWYEKAIQYGEADALYNLAMIYYQGRGVEQDFKKAAYYLHTLANKGDTQAQNLYASLFLEGKGVKYSPETAFLWFKRAAQAGYVQAMFNLATAYRSGTGVAQDDKKALYWYKKAAEKNFAPAENIVAYMYAEGRGTKKDVEQAETWFYRASEHGLKLADKNLSALRHQGAFSLSTFQTRYDIRDHVLSDKHIDLATWLEVHNQTIL